MTKMINILEEIIKTLHEKILKAVHLYWLYNYGSKKKTTVWKETHSLIVMSSYKLENIWNVDEFEIYYHALPSKPMMHFTNE